MKEVGKAICQQIQDVRFNPASLLNNIRHVKSASGYQSAELTRLAFLWPNLAGAMFNILVMLHGLLGIPDNLKLRKRRGMVRWAFNELASQVSWEMLTRVTCMTRPEIALFVWAIFGEVSEET